MVMKELMTNKTLLESIKEDVSIIGSPLENLEKLGQLDPKSEAYNELYNKVISVGEYPIPENEVIQL